jgi:hypothetical protein
MRTVCRSHTMTPRRKIAKRLYGERAINRSRAQVPVSVYSGSRVYASCGL